MTKGLWAVSCKDLYRWPLQTPVHNVASNGTLSTVVDQLPLSAISSMLLQALRCTCLQRLCPLTSSSASRRCRRECVQVCSFLSGQCKAELESDGADGGAVPSRVSPGGGGGHSHKLPWRHHHAARPPDCSCCGQPPILVPIPSPAYPPALKMSTSQQPVAPPSHVFPVLLRCLSSDQCLLERVLV